MSRGVLAAAACKTKRAWTGSTTCLRIGVLRPGIDGLMGLMGLTTSWASMGLFGFLNHPAYSFKGAWSKGVTYPLVNQWVSQFSEPPFFLGATRLIDSTQAPRQLKHARCICSCQAYQQTCLGNNDTSLGHRVGSVSRGNSCKRWCSHKPLMAWSSRGYGSLNAWLCSQ